LKENQKEKKKKEFLAMLAKEKISITEDSVET